MKLAKITLYIFGTTSSEIYETPVPKLSKLLHMENSRDKILLVNSDWHNLLLGMLLKTKSCSVITILPLKISILDLSLGIYIVKYMLPETGEKRIYMFCRYNSPEWENVYRIIEEAIKKKTTLTASFLTSEDGTQFIFKAAVA